MDQIITWLQEHIAARQAISTALLFIIAFGVRVILSRRIRLSTDLSSDIRRRWIAQIRLGTFLFLLLGLMIIWGRELQTFALSVVAIAAAIVIATKELIMCVSGTMLKSNGRSFRIGDRIEINNLRGDVIDQTLLTTTILEIGPGQTTHQHTGRSIVLPNSVFLTAPVVNESFTDEYVLHSFIVPMTAKGDWHTTESKLLEAAILECKPFLNEARAHMEHVGEAQGLQPLSVEPRVTLQMPEPDRINLVVRIPVPARKKGRIEQSILRRYIASLPAPAEEKNEAG